MDKRCNGFTEGGGGDSQLPESVSARYPYDSD